MIYLRLFFEFFKVGLFSIGGGLATIPFLTDLGSRTGWFTSGELANMIAISESTPGPMGVNMATYVGFHLRGIPGGAAEETGDWVYPQDYTGPDGTVYELHTRLATYPEALVPRCKGWTLNEEQLARFCEMAAACREKGVELTVVLPPMADIVLTDACMPFGIDQAMAAEFLPQLAAWAEEYGFAVLDYEWANRPDGCDTAPRHARCA